MPGSISMANNSVTGNSVSSSSTSSPILIDGYEEDELLARSKFLHRVEVLRRRSRRVKQLTWIYRDHYWSLMEELKLKYREYYWDHGKSPFLEDNENLNICNNVIDNNGNNRCGVSNCKMKAMAMTRFCHMHILSDPKQKLYKPCNYAIIYSPTGPVFCGKPVLRSMVPSLCGSHLEKADKYVTRSLKNAGLNISSTAKFAPKFQVILVEYISQIQSKRRKLKAALRMSGAMEGNCS